MGQSANLKGLKRWEACGHPPKRGKRLLMLFVSACMLWSSLAVVYPEAAEALENQTPASIGTDALPIVETHSDRWLVIPEASAPPQLDGVLSEPLWTQAASRSGFLTMYYNEKMEADADTEVSLTYSDTHLYIGLKGYAGTDGHPETERVDILLAPKNVNDRYYQIPLVIHLGPKVIKTIWQWEHTALEVEGAVSEIDIQSNYWTAEVAVPISSLQSEPVQSGDEWRINVLRYYGIAAPKPFSSLVPLRTSYLEHTGKDNGYFIIGDVFNHGRMGSFFFDKLPALSGLAEPEIWQPANAELRYVSFHEKELYVPEISMEDGEVVNLYWRSPDQQRVAINEVHVDSALQTIRFQHPDPEDRGMYQVELVWNDNGTPRYMLLGFDRHALIDAGEQLNAHLLVEPDIERTAVAAAPPSATVQQLLDIIPPQPGIIFARHPEMPELDPDTGNLTWSINNPNVLIGKNTGTVYPNDQFPETKVLTATNKLGETVEYPYYEDEQGRKYFITAHLWYEQKDYVLGQIKSVASTDPLGAARLLYRFAERYQEWVPTNDYPGNGYPTDVGAGPPYHYWGGTWYRWYTSDLYYMRNLTEAYSIVKQTNAFDVLSAEVGRDVEQFIVDDMFKASAEVIDTYTVLNHNMEPGIWHGLIMLSKALGDPRYLHDAVDRIESFASNQFLLDGFFREVTASYHNQSTSGMDRSLAAAKGWSDPVGYVSARTGKNFYNLNLSDEFSILEKALEVQNYATYPDGKYLPNQDTWASSQSPNPRLAEGSLLLPGAGIARLTRGWDEEQQQVYMTFSPKYGHNHLDPLNLTMYAEGQELLPDIGYSHTKYGKWKASTLAHNTVVVDSKDLTLPSGRDGGNIERFVPANETVQVMRASQENAYPGVEEYSREPWSIGFNGAADGEGYVVDLFRVAGGNRHEYTLNGDANRDAVFDTELALSDYGPHLLPEGVQVTMPEKESDFGDAEGHYYGYIYVQDVKSAAIPDGQYDVTLRTESADGPLANMKITGFVGEGNNELFIGKSPSMRSTRLNGSSREYDNNIEADKYFMPKLVVRRESTNEALTSQFVTVMEPYGAEEQPRISDISKLELDHSGEDSVAISVTYGNTTDIILSSPSYSDSSEPLRIDDIELHGEMGFIRLEDGKIKEMHLIGGTLLKKGDNQVDHNGAITGTISGIMRKAEGAANDGFLVDRIISNEAIGQHIIVTHPDQSTHGYKITGIIAQDGQTLIQTAQMDPGFQFKADGSSSMIFYPRKQWNGEHTYRIENLAQYIVGAPVFSTMAGDSVHELTEGELLRITADASNRLPYEVPITLIVALKNGQHRVESIRYLRKSIQPEQIESLNTAFQLPDELDGYYVEAFLWDSLDEMKPISKSVRLGDTGSEYSIESGSEFTESELGIVTNAGEAIIAGRRASDAGQQVTARVIAPDGEIVFIGQTAADTEGSFSFKFALSESPLEGDYKLAIGNKSDALWIEEFEFADESEGENPEQPTVPVPNPDEDKDTDEKAGNPEPEAAWSDLIEQLTELAVKHRSGETDYNQALFISEAFELLNALTLIPFDELSVEETDTDKMVAIPAQLIQQTAMNIDEVLKRLRTELADQRLDDELDQIKRKLNTIRLAEVPANGRLLQFRLPKDAADILHERQWGLSIQADRVQFHLSALLLSGIKVPAKGELRLKLQAIEENEAARLAEAAQKRAGEYKRYRVAGALYDMNLVIVNGQSEVPASPFPDPIEVSVPWKLQYSDIGKLGAYRLHSDGSWQYVGGSVAPSGDRFDFATRSFSTYAILEYSRQFQDTLTHWAAADVEWIASRHLIDGVDEDRFSPDRSITRAEYTALIVRALKLAPDKGGDSFRDVSSTAWYADVIQTAAAAGLISGYNGTFRPDAPITREELTKLVMEAYRFNDGAKKHNEQASGFADDQQISPWAKSYVSDAVQLGFVQGMDDSRFAPQASATRAQAVTVIRRLLAVLETNS